MKRRLLLSALFLCSAVIMIAQSVTVNGASGWLETASIEWQPVEKAESYNVYITGQGVNDVKIDDQLIRNYGDYFRADIPGLKAGNYTMRVSTVVDGIESPSAVSAPVTVKSFDRSGFAFTNGRIPGAYKADGTLKENAVVIYITENTKNSVEFSVKTSSSGYTTCVGFQNILDAFKKGQESRPFVFRLVGQITDFATMYNGDIVVENKSNHNNPITIEGVGNDAVADGWGIRLKGAASVEIRNIATMNVDSSEGDNIGLQQDNEYIWVHHCDFFYGHAGSDGDQAKGDGALDCKRSTYVTFSYNHYWDAGKCNLLGLSENTTDGLYITYHHNWFDHSDSRHPRVRFYSAHVYNNYYDGNSKYGVGSTKGSSVFVEKNYFRNCKNPMMISMQGTDTKMGTDEKNSPTFSKEDGGIIKSFDNIMVEGYTYVPYSKSNGVHFDAYDVTDRNSTVPSSVTSKQGGNSYNNFDTNSSIMYEYTAHEASEVVQVVTSLAGRQDGGDFKWAFNNAVDDASYAVNPELKNALVNYNTKLVAIQGDGEAEENPDGGGDNGGDNGGNGGEAIEGDVTHNFTTQGLVSEFFVFNGNLSTSKGEVTYNGIKLTTVLKIESKTTIDFTTSQDGELTLVFAEGSATRIFVNGSSYTPSNGILKVKIPAGTHQIRKHDTTDLFYISITLDDDPSTGIDGVEASLRLYPNPVKDLLRIECEVDILDVEIYNIAGVLVATEFGHTKAISMSHLSKGIYIVRIRTELGYIQRSVMKF
ncbi:MAG: T9SS type A sorting domain-containing protein [Bacteroidales bacterium]